MRIGFDMGTLLMVILVLSLLVAVRFSGFPRQATWLQWACRFYILVLAGMSIGAGAALYDRYVEKGRRAPPAIHQFHADSRFA